jgi:hypothetical protein
LVGSYISPLSNSGNLFELRCNLFASKVNLDFIRVEKMVLSKVAVCFDSFWNVTSCSYDYCTLHWLLFVSTVGLAKLSFGWSGET